MFCATSAGAAESGLDAVCSAMETPIARSVHANSIIAIAGDGPIENDDDATTRSAHLDGIREYIRSGISTL